MLPVPLGLLHAVRHLSDVLIEILARALESEIVQEHVQQKDYLIRIWRAVEGSDDGTNISIRQETLIAVR